LKTPKFWQKKTTISYLLLPLSMIYLCGHIINCFIKTTKRFFAKKSDDIYNPIICIGNLVAGGAGKTPVAIAIGKILQELKIDFVYLSSGYGRRITGCKLVNPEKHDAKDVGDEPLLLAEIASTFVSSDKQVGANVIRCQGPEKKLIIMDDGLQNPSIAKDFVILIIDGNYGFGNGFLIPAGPLREPIDTGIKKADLVIIIGEDRWQIAKKFCSNKKIIMAEIRPSNPSKFTKQSVVAFCGIGRPEKFFDSLERNNINIVARFFYSDHHQYHQKELEKMINLAKQKNVILITTKKDWVRLDKSYQDKIEFFDIEIEFESDQYLRKKLIKLSR
jgi:tetraacyldisaccharide 4'-kinase